MMDPSSGWGAASRWFRREQLPSHKLAKGTVRRIARFAAPYKRMLLVFLALIVVDAVVGTVNPLIYGRIIDKGILGHNSGLIVALAGLIAGLAIFDALLSLAMRWYSARIGDGPLFDMRSKVFRHLQRVP